MYEAMRAEIADWLAEELRKAPRPRAAALGQAADPEQSESVSALLSALGAELEPDDQDFLKTPLDDLDQGQLLALVKSVKLKSKKGEGKGKGPRKCYECDSEGHIASECPIRLERVKNGGPERLPKGDAGDVDMGGFKRKGKGGSKGGKVCKGAVTASLWKTYNPYPNVIKQSQWGHWRPAAPGQPLQMASEGTPWFQVLGAVLSVFSQVRPQHQKTRRERIRCAAGRVRRAGRAQYHNCHRTRQLGWS